MATAIGIDCGTQRTKGVLLRDGKIVARAITLTAFDTGKAARAVKAELLNQVGLHEESAGAPIGVTGIGGEQLTDLGTRVNDISAAVSGARFLAPDTKLVLDLGAENTRAIRLKDGGIIAGYEQNDRCASGTGTFVETMARVLNVPVERLGTLALSHKKDLTISAQCVVFVESEVISLIHQRESPEDIAYGVLRGISSRIAAIAGQLGRSGSVTVVGGLARSQGLLQCLSEALGQAVHGPEDAEYAGALGAALHVSGG